MHSSCPNCEAKLNDFEFSCHRCGWSLDGENNPDGVEDLSLNEEQPPTEFELFRDRARDSIEGQEFESAVKALNRAIVDAPDEQLGECYSLRGYAQLKAANFEAAENDCSEAIDRNWFEAQTYAWRAAARGEQNKWRLAFDDLAEACQLAGNQKDPYLQLIQSYVGVASEFYREEIKKGNDDADMFFDRGWVYFQSATYTKALRDFQLALKQDPEHAWASVGLAMTLFETNKLDEKLMRRVLKLCSKADENASPECQRAGIRLSAIANHQFGHFARASKDLKQFRELAKGDSELVVECGELRQQLGDQVAAISDFTRAMEIEPSQTLALQRRGDSYSAIRNYPLAIDDYSKFLRYFPEDLSARVKRGQVYLKAGRPDLALNDFDRVLETDKTYCDAYLGRSEIFLQRSQLPQALTECEKAVRLDNQRHQAFSTLAEIYFKLCDYGRSIEEFGRAIRIADKPEDKAQYLYRRGTAQYELGDFPSAVSDMNKAIELRPNHAGTWIWKAAAASRLEKWQDAILSLERAITIRPEIAEQYQTLGKPVAQKAIEYFRHQIQRGQKKVEIYRSRGLAYQFIGHSDQAVADYTVALHMKPDAETMTRRGQTFASTGDHEQAIRDFAQVIRANPNDHWTRFCRARSRSATGVYQKALQDIVKAIMIAPRQARYHVLHGELLQRADTCRVKNDWSKVIKAYDRALRIDSADSATYARRATAHLNAGQFLNAIHDFTRALELKPGNEGVLVQRGQAYLRNEQYALAMEDFELALTRNSKMAKAYVGRSNVLIHQKRHEYALIWLTKAFHRLEKKKRELCEVVFARGKVYYHMRRFQPAIADFTAVLELGKDDRRTQVAASLARGIALVQLEEWGQAKQDFQHILSIEPRHAAAQASLHWMQDLSQTKPPIFVAPDELVRPIKPGVSRDPVELTDSGNEWSVDSPFNSWILRSAAGKEYGPVVKETLDLWVSQGRIEPETRILRADWPKWKKVTVVYPELAQTESFPGIEIRPVSSNHGSANSQDE